MRQRIESYLSHTWWVPLALVPIWVLLLLFVIFFAYEDLSTTITIMANVAAALAIVGVAALTSWYAYNTERMATGVRQQGEMQARVLAEMEKERELRYSPLVYITGVSLWQSNVPKSVTLRNLGYGVALEVHCVLKSGNRVFLKGHCPGLVAGEEQEIDMSSTIPLSGIGSGMNFVIEYYGADIGGPTYLARFSFEMDGSVKPLEFGKVHPAT